MNALASPFQSTPEEEHERGGKVKRERRLLDVLDALFLFHVCTFLLYLDLFLIGRAICGPCALGQLAAGACTPERGGRGGLDTDTPLSRPRRDEMSQHGVLDVRTLWS